MGRFTLPNRLAVLWWPQADIPATLGSPSQATDIGNVNVVDLIGTGQGEALASMSGWDPQPSVYNTPDFTSNIVGTVPGDTTIPESSITFWFDDTTTTIYDALYPEGTTGAIGIFFDGSATGEESNLYLATIQSRRRSFERDAGHQFTVDFALAAPVVGTIVA